MNNIIIVMKSNIKFENWFIVLKVYHLPPHSPCANTLTNATVPAFKANTTKDEITIVVE